mmetsp:Transcript_38068/g.71368  ORF Transcript_38068/g.71368 Transcript_38068/m.71368 type:complete len:282 (-) Transcript_38068:357-1202(-)
MELADVLQTSALIIDRQNLWKVLNRAVILHVCPAAHILWLIALLLFFLVTAPSDELSRCGRIILTCRGFLHTLSAGVLRAKFVELFDLGAAIILTEAVALASFFYLIEAILLCKACKVLDESIIEILTCSSEVGILGDCVAGLTTHESTNTGLQVQGGLATHECVRVQVFSGLPTEDAVRVELIRLLTVRRAFANRGLCMIVLAVVSALALLRKLEAGHGAVEVGALLQLILVMSEGARLAPQASALLKEFAHVHLDQRSLRRSFLFDSCRPLGQEVQSLQ